MTLSPIEQAKTGRCSALRWGAPRSTCARRCRRRSRRSRRCSRGAKRTRDRLVDDRHRSAADELLRLHEAEVGLDAGRVAVHEERDRPRRSEHARLGVAHAVDLGELDGASSQDSCAACRAGRRDEFLVDLVDLVAVHRSTLSIARRSRGTGERAHPRAIRAESRRRARS
jgi:hypothetical protein